ncbi:MAG: hypothetical protein HY897_06455 [Deltaproteobacteria bacterium]|nr:hypothetical protein [Deltaproteobacteria bacterium]
MRSNAPVIVAVLVLLAPHGAGAAEVTGIEDKVRSSEAVVVAEAQKVEPGSVQIKIAEVLKGSEGIKGVKRIGGEVGGGGENDFAKGEKCILFVGEIHDDFGVLFGGLDGKLCAKQGDMNEFKGAVKNVVALDGTSGKGPKSGQLKKMLGTPGFQNKYIALQEILSRSGDYDLLSLKSAVAPVLKDKTPKIRAKAVLAHVRIFDAIAKGTSRDEDLLKTLIGMLDDPDGEVREMAHGQLKKNSGNRSITFDAKASPEERKKKIAEWKRWMSEKKDKSVETEFEDPGGAPGGE